MPSVKDYMDERGIMRRVQVDKSTTRPSEGVPLDVFDILDEIYGECPLSFRKALYKSLWDRGLIERKDYKRRNASNDFRSAFQASIARDAASTITKILED